MTPRGLARILEHDARVATLTTAQRTAVEDVVARLRCTYGEMEHVSELQETIARMLDLDRADSRAQGMQPSRVLECAYVASTLASMHPRLRAEAVERATVALRPWSLSARDLGSRGGKASASALTPEQRKERGRRAIAARWAKREQSK